MKKLVLVLLFILGITIGGTAQDYSMNFWDGSQGLFGLGMPLEKNEFSTRGLFYVNSDVASGITNDDFETPLGSGLVILLGAGLGYMALKRKEDKQ